MVKQAALTVAVAVVSVVAGSCSSARYFVDHDTQNDFGDYTKFAWFELATPPDKAKPPTEANTILTNRIRRAVEAELTGRGFDKSAVGDADFLVTFSVVLQPQWVVYNTGWAVPYGGWGWGWGGWGWGWGAGWTGGTSRLQTYTEGTIVVDVLDTGSRTLVWRGIIENAFSKPNPDDTKIRKVVAKVMEAFPPA